MRAARQGCGFDQDDLGNLLGLSRSSIANIEAGRQRVSADIAARLIAELGMKVPGWHVDRSATVLAVELAKARRALKHAVVLMDGAAAAAREAVGR